MSSSLFEQARSPKGEEPGRKIRSSEKTVDNFKETRFLRSIFMNPVKNILVPYKEGYPGEVTIKYIYKRT